MRNRTLSPRRQGLHSLVRQGPHSLFPGHLSNLGQYSPRAVRPGRHPSGSYSFSRARRCLVICSRRAASSRGLWSHSKPPGASRSPHSADATGVQTWKSARSRADSMAASVSPAPSSRSRQLRAPHSGPSDGPERTPGWRRIRSVPARQRSSASRHSPPAPAPLSRLHPAPPPVPGSNGSRLRRPEPPRPLQLF